jgi:hypothetical protein
MKKLFALLFVCAGLTAMAAQPMQVSKGTMQKAHAAKMMKASLADKFTAPVMQGVKKDMQSPISYMKARGLTPDDNVLAKKAPRRITKDDMVGTRLAFVNVYDWSYDQTTGADVYAAWPFHDGGWDVTLAESEYGDEYLTIEGLLYGLTGYTPVAELDYTNNTITVPAWQYVAKNTSKVHSGRNRTDTIINYFIINEEWLTEDAKNDITGTIYSSGAFDLSGWMYGVEYVINVYKSNTLSSTDTTVVGYGEVFRNTTLVVPTGKQEMIPCSSNDMTGANTNPEMVNVYMFQYIDEDTVNVWNFFGGGLPGYQIVLNEDGTCFAPDQPVQESDTTNGYWDAYWLYTWGNSWPDNPSTSDLTESWANGTVTPDMITIPGYISLINRGVSYPMTGIKLYYTNGNTFLYEKSVAPVISYEVGDGVVIVTATAADGATVMLMDADGNVIDNPYTVEMIEEEQEVTFYAIAQEEGKIATYAGAVVVVPALATEEFELGDVNHSGGVDIEDVTILINAVLGNQPEVYYPEQANCNGQGGVDIEDVTALISRVLNGAW